MSVWPDSSRSSVERDAQALARQLCSPKTGVVKQLLALPRAGGQIPLVHITAGLPDYGVLPSGGRIARPGGSHFTIDGAFNQVLFEAIERYCASIVDYSALLLSRPVTESFLWGERFPLFAPFQYARDGWPFRPLTAGSSIYWAVGRSLISGRPCFIPASFVYIPYRPASEDEWLGPSTSTGMAAAWSWARACLTGLLEACERDAFTIMWMNRLSLPRLRLDPESALGCEIARVLSGRDATLTLVNLTSDFAVPTVMAVLRSSAEGQPLVTIGASAKPTFAEAIKKALAEAVSDCERLRHVFEQPGTRWQPAADFSNIVDFEWHSLFYTFPEYQPHLDFLTASPIEQPIPTALERQGTDPDVLRGVLSVLAEKGEDVVAVDLTTREIAEFGVHVVKVMVPGAVPLNPDHRFPWLGHRRLYTVPRLLGYRATDTRVDELNPMPHPFA
jgi:ribosomal protein S12 methylthiotransferase accessory factor